MEFISSLRLSSSFQSILFISFAFFFFFPFDFSCGNFCPSIADEAALSFLHKKNYSFFLRLSCLPSSGLQLVKSSIHPPFTVSPRLISLFFPGDLYIGALVYFRGPWENSLTLWQYFKIILFQITKRLTSTDLT